MALALLLGRVHVAGRVQTGNQTGARWLCIELHEDDCGRDSAGAAGVRRLLVSSSPRVANRVRACGYSTLKK